MLLSLRIPRSLIDQNKGPEQSEGARVWEAYCTQVAYRYGIEYKLGESLSASIEACMRNYIEPHMLHSLHRP